MAAASLAPPGPHAAEAGLPAGVSTREMGNVRVLLVEDDPLQAVMLQEVFRAVNDELNGWCHYELTTVQTAIDALEAVRGTPARPVQHILLLDVFLSNGPHGSEILPSVRKLVGPNAAVIMISAHAQMGLVQTCMKRGADAYLTKPISPATIQHLWQYAFKVRAAGPRGGLAATRWRCGGVPRRHLTHGSARADAACQRGCVRVLAAERGKGPRPARRRGAGGGVHC